MSSKLFRGDPLTHELLRKLLHYDPDTGEFHRRTTTSHNSQSGQRCGWRNGNGYLKINVAGEKYYSHRLAWLYMTGEWPANLIDHIDRDPSNNRWANLRDATQQENLWNSNKSRANTSGLTGVSWSRKARKWVAQICCDGNRYLGLFDSPEEASAAYQKSVAERELLRGAVRSNSVRAAA